MRELLITGGRIRPDALRFGDGRFYECAILLRLSLDDGKTEAIWSIDTGNEHYPYEHPNLQFSAGCLGDRSLWLPTDTEIYQLSYPDSRELRCFSHSCFQNVHSVSLLDGELWCTSTGLDMVVVLDADSGEIRRQYNAELKDPWHRFDRSVDYRLVHSTRPHDAHPNYVFQYRDEHWVTRCFQQDAICLEDPSRRIQLTDIEDRISVHDGWVEDRKVFFTRVDGKLIVADLETCEVEETIYLLENDHRESLGWCRGLLKDGDVVYVAFSAIRPSRNADKLKWLRRAMGKPVSKCATVLSYSLKERRILAEYPIPIGEIDAIYSVLAPPEPT